MKDSNALCDEELELVLNILKSFNHQMPDYSDVYVDNIIYAQAITNKDWMPDECRNISHNTIELLNGICEYGFLRKANGVGAFAITKFGLEFLLSNI